LGSVFEKLKAFSKNLDRKKSIEDVNMNLEEIILIRPIKIRQKWSFVKAKIIMTIISKNSIGSFSLKNRLDYS
jgi:hypothetical protein